MHPALVRHALFPLHEWAMKRPTLSYLAEIEKAQWLSREELEALQARKLKDLLATAQAHSPWHAERIQAAGLEPSSGGPLTLADLPKLPTMTRADASANRDRLVWKEAPGGVFPYTTGGSSGQPLIFYFGRKRQAADAACRFRARRWWGQDVGEREVFLWGAPVELNKTDRIKTLRDRLFNQLLLNAFEMKPERMDDYLVAIERFNPRCIYGYASSLALLAAHAKSRGNSLKLPDLRVVGATGEPLYPEQRAIIQEVFGAPAANEYGCRDGGLVALESPDGQMLVNSESIILEVLDAQGRAVAPGEMGEAVLTHLCSEAQPFIRYRTGDMVRQSDAHCRAGRGLHVIAEVVGRRTDFVVKPDGTIMHALAVIYVLRAVKGVGEFKIIQHATDRLEVQIVPDAYWQDCAKDLITEQLRARMGASVAVDIELKQSIPPEASGKHRYVVSHVSLPDNLLVAE
ncbi:phenylacetate--CoA ligase family protein [Methylococcus sp. EFPC2]|uniref:phenylacetate--CoA ligase family protein n=1 Tax=Methylococcus sp. EFPC2 TaxID=2812648 RepID=UPI0019682986|nr:phenylacetate--CoA ligase family protein [Methylococcus sp. EFPC2]QSA97308.1 phenylacetate--CoA ligase family protein [Methylococcus sp. EFPC2]